MKNVVTTRKNEEITTAPWLSQLFNNPLAGLLWLPIRVWLGYQWIEASIHKLTSPAWMQTGTALQGFWAKAVAIPAQGTPPIAYPWYRAFLQMLLNTQSYVWFAKLISVGELLIGIALILGIFTGFTAFMGGFMNWNFMMAGSASVNPLFLAISFMLILAWKVAGYFGADYFLIPWSGALVGARKPQMEPAPVTSPSGAD